ncbi:MAG: NHL repeat-containing protein [Ignavibacteriae bacterium]|nr:NHL repeat-containing protein [Ignavibacteriota bacterium]MCB9217420.1 NHL repeat-containing protein [Ignavibacteria bacterium]
MELLIPLLFFFGSFSEPVDLDHDIEGHLYVVDAGRDLVVKYSSKGDSLDAVGGFGTGTEEFDHPIALYARRGTDLFVADHNNHRIQRFDRRLDYVTTLFTRDNPDERIRFGYPLDVAVSRQGDIVVLDGENYRVAIFNSVGEFVRSFGDITSGEGRLIDPISLELDDNDNVYVLDGGEIKVYDPFGAWLRTIPPPRDRAYSTFSIGGDSLVALADSLLLIYRITDHAVEDSLYLDSSTIPVATHYHGGYLYSIGANRVDVLKLRVLEAEMLHGE